MTGGRGSEGDDIRRQEGLLYSVVGGRALWDAHGLATTWRRVAPIGS